MKSSILIGDKITDIKAGDLAGVGKLLLYGNTVKDDSIVNYKKLNKLTEAISFI